MLLEHTKQRYSTDRSRLTTIPPLFLNKSIRQESVATAPCLYTNDRINTMAENPSRHPSSRLPFHTNDSKGSLSTKCSSNSSSTSDTSMFCRRRWSIESERDCFPHQRYNNNDANMYFNKNRVTGTERSITYVDNNADGMSFYSDDDKYDINNEIVRRVNERTARNNSNGKYHY